MESISLQSTPDKYLITIDKSVVEADYILKLLEQIRMEFLAKKVSFDDSVEDVGEEIKMDWWNKNKARLLGPGL